MSNSPKPKATLSTLLAAACAILFFIIVQAGHFHGRPYRQDEAWVIHYALANIERVGLLNHILQPLHQLYPENLWLDLWVYAFGHHEHITRYLSSLLTMLALAMIYRLASALFDRHSGLLALALLGSYGIFVYYGHEARPYALLVFCAASFTWALLRFIEKATAKRGAIAWLIAAIAVFSHPFIAFLLVAQLLCVLIFVRWDRVLYQRGAALYACIGLLVAYRGYINFADRSGQIAYNINTSWAGLREFYQWFRIEPEALGLFLFLGGCATLLLKLAHAVGFPGGPSQSARPWLVERMRWPSLWREGWFALSILFMLGLALLFNAYAPSLTPRNMLILAPSIALVALIALRQLPRHLQLVVLVMLCLPFVSGLRIKGGNAGYAELAAYVAERYDSERDRLVVLAESLWETIPINFYLQERAGINLAPPDIFFISRVKPTDDPYAPPAFDPRWTVNSREADATQRLREFIGDGQRIWLIKGNPYREAQHMLSELEQGASLYSAVDFPGDTYYRPLEVLEYRRQPDDLATLWRFGESVSLLHWQLNDSHIVQPCGQISVDTWWSADAPLTEILSATLVLADANGNGIANADGAPGGIYLSTIWQPGQVYFDERVLSIPCDMAEGEYPLLLAMYQVPNAEQPLRLLPIHTSAGEPAGRDYQYLTTLHVRR